MHASAVRVERNAAMSNRLESKIEYEQLPAGGGMTRRQGRWLIVLLIVNTMLLAVGVAGPQVGPTVRKQIDDYFARRSAAKVEQQKAAARVQQHAKLMADQAQWLSYEFAPGTIVFEEDPKIAAAHLISGKGYRAIETQNMSGLSPRWQPPVIAPNAPAIARVAGYAFGSNESVLFLHERRTPGGQPKLVCIAFSATQTARDAAPNGGIDLRAVTHVTLFAYAFDPFAADSNATELSQRGTAGRPSASARRCRRPEGPGSFHHPLSARHRIGNDRRLAP